MANLAAKYRPHTFQEVVGQDIVMEIIEKICKTDPLTIRNFLLIGPAGCSKAQPLNSLVLTPQGYKQMGNIKIGDSVFTSRGNIGRVSGVYPQGVRPIYKITLQDKTFIYVSDEHLNVVYRYNEDKKVREDFCLTTTQLIELFNKSRFKLRMDCPRVDWDEHDVPIDPYLLGALIGDRSLSSGNLGFSNSEEDIIEKVDTLLRRDWNMCLEKVDGDNVDYNIVALNDTSCKYVFTYKGHEYRGCGSIRSVLESEGYPMFDPDTLIRLANNDAPNVLQHYPELGGSINIQVNSEYTISRESGLRATLSKLGLLCKSSQKHIPDIYLHNSLRVRQQLLQGLMDTDGSIGKDRSVSFATSSMQLSLDFEFLVRSLGIRDTVTECDSSYVNSEGERIHCLKSYSHSMKVPSDIKCCSSAKLVARNLPKQNEPIRNIVSIEYSHDEECQCIMIDHPDHTYISDYFIPTHNTTTARIIARALNGEDYEPIEIDAASHGGVDSIRDIVEQARSYPIGYKYKVFIIDEVHSVSTAGFQVLLKTLEENPAAAVFVLCTTNPEKIPATILSRVQTFQIKKISLDGIFNRLKYIIEQENKSGASITYEEDALNYIAKLGNGGMRDSITLLDKALAYSNNLNSENIEKALNLPNYDDYFLLLNAIAKKDNKSIVEIIHRVYNSGVNFIKFFEGFLSFVSNIVKYIYMKDINSTMIPSHYQDKICNYGTAHAALCLKLSNKLVKLNQELKTTQYLQELAISYLCTAPATK